MTRIVLDGWLPRSVARIVGLMLVAAFLIVPCSQAAGLKNVSLRSPLPLSDWLVSTLYSNGLYFASSNRGAIYRSKDFLSWEMVWDPVATGQALGGKLFVDGDKLVGVGVQERIIVSNDGVGWQLLNARPGVFTLSAYVHDGGKYVAAGGSVLPQGAASLIVRSSDGVAWTRSEGDFPYRINCIKKFNGMWIGAGGDESTVGGMIIISTDLSTWTEVAAGPVPFQALAVSDVYCIAVGGGLLGSPGRIYRTNDGKAWSDVTPPNVDGRLEDVCYDGGIFYAVGVNGQILWSTNGEAWAQSFYQKGLVLSSIVRSPAGFFISGEGGVVLFSRNGEMWRRWDSGLGGDFLRATGCANGFGAVSGRGLVGISPDGIVWKTARHPTSDVPRLLDIAYADERFVAVGDRGRVVTSQDGEVWGSLVVKSDVNWISVAGRAGGGFQMISSSGTIADTVDGKDFQESELPLADFETASRIIRTNGKTFAICIGPNGSGFLLVNEGLTWRRCVMGGLVTCVASGGGSFVASGLGGAIWCSVDGLSWIRRESHVVDDLNGIIFDGLQFVAAGANGRVLSSRDGILWVVEKTLPVYSIRDLATYAGRTVFICSDGGIYSADNALFESPSIVNYSTMSNHIKESPVIHGYSIRGAERQKVLLRSIGRELQVFGVSDTAGDPSLVCFDSAGMIVDRIPDSLQRRSEVEGIADEVGAFDIGQVDTVRADLIELSSGLSTTVSAGEASGVILMEMYVINGVRGSVVNTSSRFRLRPGASSTIGFVVADRGRLALLFRVVSKGLTNVGLQPFDGRLVSSVYDADGMRVVKLMDAFDENAKPFIKSTEAVAGAFPIDEVDDSNSFVIVVSQGIYTVQISGDGMEGWVLVETYVIG